MTTYYDLKIRCPACISEGKSGDPVAQWYHANGCGGKLQIGDNAYLKCVSCGHTKHIKNWRYACPTHESDFKPCTGASFANAISTAGQVTSIAGIRWLKTLMDNMGEDW